MNEALRCKENIEKANEALEYMKERNFSIEDIKKFGIDLLQILVTTCFNIC